MQNKNNKLIAAVCVVLLIFIVTAFFILVDIDEFMVRFLAVFFLLFSSMVFTIGFYLLSLAGKNHNIVLLRAGVGSTLILYVIVTILLSFISNLFANNLTLYIMLNFGIALLAGVAILFLVLASRSTASDDMRTMGKKAFMDEVERRLFNLSADSKNAKFHQKINRLYDAVKYADKIGISSVDYVLDDTLTRLESALALGEEEASQVNITSIFDEINSLLTRRKEEISISKRGGF